jgi:hypothetical protein
MLLTIAIPEPYASVTRDLYYYGSILLLLCLFAHIKDSGYSISGSCEHTLELILYLGLSLAIFHLIFREIIDVDTL